MNTTAARATGTSRWQVWTGRVLSAIPVVLMVFSAYLKLSHAPQAVAAFVSMFGWPEGALTGLAILELATVVLYLIPQTAMLGAILMVGYLGGAVATHLRIGDPGWAIPAGLGVLAFGGMFFRDARVRALIPFRRTA